MYSEELKRGKIKLISTNTFDYYFHNPHEIKKTFFAMNYFQLYTSCSRKKILKKRTF